MRSTGKESGVLTARLDCSRLTEFIRERHKDITLQRKGVGPFSLTNERLVNEGIESIKDNIAEGQRVLDVGIGRGYAMDLFRQIGLEPTGITLDTEELEVALSRGHDVKFMDMSFLDFEDGHYDIVWARHCLEHSIFPYFTLSEFYRVLKPGGIIYVEVPAPKTDSRHENNKNHYSVLGKLMWASLIRRCGFENLKAMAIGIGVKDRGDLDKYYRFVANKGA